MGLINKTEQQYYNDGIFGNYQFVSLNDIINQFMIVYTGEDKIISKVSRVDVAFHAQRALAELSFDTFKSFKSQEITIPASLTTPLPQDYVGYTKLSWTDGAGIKHVLYPTSKTSNPINPHQNSDGDFRITAECTIQADGSIYLDDEYKNIKNGMKVVGLQSLNNGVQIPPSITVYYSAVLSGSTIKQVLLWDGSNQIHLINDLGFATNDVLDLHFENQDGSLVLTEELSRQINECVTVVSEYKITTPSGTDTDNIEIGMVVSGYGVPNGTLVVGIVDTVIYINKANTPRKKGRI